MSLALYLVVRHRYRKARGSISWASMSAMMKELPVDFAILSPSASRCCPCTHLLTTCLPV